MRKVEGTTLWIGHAGDARNLVLLNESGIRAVVDLAEEEPPLQLSRELVVLRFPLVDGGGNPRWLLEMALTDVERLLRWKVETVVTCGGGLSRSPCVAAGALARLRGWSFDEALSRITKSASADVAPGFAAEVCALLV